MFWTGLLVVGGIGEATAFALRRRRPYDGPDTFSRFVQKAAGVGTARGRVTLAVYLAVVTWFAFHIW